MNVVSSRRARYIFAHVKPHASNLLFVGLLWASGPAMCFANTLAPGTICALKKQNFPLGQLVLC